MTIIKNIGPKIINIGTTVLMPDQTMKASDAVCETPAIKAFVAKGLLSLTKGEKKTAAGKAAKGGKAGKSTKDEANEGEETSETESEETSETESEETAE